MKEPWKQNVALRKTMAELVEARDRAVALAEHGLRAMGEANDLLREVAVYGLPYDATPREGIEGITRHIDRAMWRNAFERTGLSKLMDEQAIKEFERELEQKPPQFSMQNIQTQVLSMHQVADEMFQRGIYNVFRQLDRHFKSHGEIFRLPGKVILRGLFDAFWCGPADNFRLSYYKHDLVNDLDRVFRVLDGATYMPRWLETKVNGHFKRQGELLRADLDRQDVDAYEDEYFRIKAHRNTNGHIWFKRADLLERANDLIAEYCNGNAVAGPRRV